MPFCMNILKCLKTRDKFSISGTRDKASKTGTVPSKIAQMEGLHKAEEVKTSEHQSPSKKKKSMHGKFSHNHITHNYETWKWLSRNRN